MIFNIAELSTGWLTESQLADNFSPSPGHMINLYNDISLQRHKALMHLMILLHIRLPIMV